MMKLLLRLEPIFCGAMKLGGSFGVVLNWNKEAELVSLLQSSVCHLPSHGKRHRLRHCDFLGPKSIYSEENIC